MPSLKSHPLADEYLAKTRAFFASRAATWNSKFGDDMPKYAAAISQAAIPDGGLAVDVGCGTGRALPPLRRAVGPDGTVIAVDVTPEMLHEARPASLKTRAALVLADARSLPSATRRPTPCSPRAWSAICPTPKPGSVSSHESSAPAAS